MEGKCKTEEFEDPDFFTNVQVAIEKELANLHKIVNIISQLRVQAAYLESDLIQTIDCTTWQDISELIGLGPHIMTAGLTEDMP